MLAIVRCLFLFAEVRWSFLCEYVINCPLFLCRGKLFFFMWACYQLSIVSVSLQRWDGSFYVTMLSFVRCLYLLPEVRWSFFYVSVLSIVWFLFLFPGVWWSFLYGYVCKCQLFISLFWRVMVLYMRVYYQVNVGLWLPFSRNRLRSLSSTVVISVIEWKRMHFEWV